jgi:4-carboxymuconolactone decarboxylase
VKILLVCTSANPRGRHIALNLVVANAGIYCRLNIGEELAVAQQPTDSNAAAKAKLRSVAPKLIDLTDQVLFGDVWERPGLSKRDRSLITVAALVSMYRPEQLRPHMERAFAHGITEEELGELVTHLAFYAGWPAAVSAASTLRSLLESKQ